MISVDMGRVSNIIAEVAAEYILPLHGHLKNADISFKSADDPVTKADHEAEKALSERLSSLLPGSLVVGEEAFASNQCCFSYFKSESPVWIIDPIDGTRNFVAGKREFGVIIALAEQNHTVAGWLYDPLSNELFCAEKGAGAWHKDRKLSVLPAAELKDLTGLFSQKVIEGKNNKSKIKCLNPVFKVINAAAHDYPRLVLNTRISATSYRKSISVPHSIKLCPGTTQRVFLSMPKQAAIPPAGTVNPTTSP